MNPAAPERDDIERPQDELTIVKAHAGRATKAVYQAMSADLTAALIRAERAEQRATALRADLRKARERARRARRELAATRASTSWRIGHTLVSTGITARRTLARVRARATR